MRLLQLSSIAAFAIGAVAITPPPNAVDGSYRAYFDKQGREVHELVSLPNGVAPDSKSTTQWITNETGHNDTVNAAAQRRDELAKRLSPHAYDAHDYGFGAGIINVWCGCGFDMNHGNCDAAVDDLKHQADGSSDHVGHIGGIDLAWYSIRGDVVAFACSNTFDSVDTTSRDWEFDAGELTTAYSAITRLCGWYIAGTLDYVSWVPTDYNAPDLGYMRWSPGLDFCSASRSSPASSC